MRTQLFQDFRSFCKRNYKFPQQVLRISHSSVGLSLGVFEGFFMRGVINIATVFFEGNRVLALLQEVPHVTNNGWTDSLNARFAGEDGPVLFAFRLTVHKCEVGCYVRRTGPIKQGRRKPIMSKVNEIFQAVYSIRIV